MSPLASKVTAGRCVVGALTSEMLTLRCNGVAIHESTSICISFVPGVHVSLRTYGLANQWRAPVVVALRRTIVDARAPLAITERSGDVKNVTKGPPGRARVPTCL